MNKKQLPTDYFINVRQKNADSILAPTTITADLSLNEILVYARQNSISDVHLIPGLPVVFRKFQQLIRADEQVLTSELIEEKIRNTFESTIVDDLMQTGDQEYVYTIPGSGRFRMSMMKERNGFTLSARVISKAMRSFEDSLMPDPCRSLTDWAQGMVLVTGPAGCGKSETLATLIEMINQTREEHIITIESPIEHVFESKRSQITQRQIDLHTLSQEAALRAALREDPDIIMISELRDLQTIRLAVTAAETGHLVLATMNTNSAVQTVSTFINSFPPDEQDIMTSMIAESLRGVISQQLVPKADGSGLVPAYEILILNMAVQNIIKQRKFEQLENAMTTNRSSGMVVFDDSLKALVESKMISAEEAYDRAFNPKQFDRYFSDEPEDDQMDEPLEGELYA